ncbi:MAG: helix-turn-helix domain-containing protein [Cyclobacteriaceae bacterium]
MSRRAVATNLLAGLVFSFSLCLTYYVIFWTGYFRVLPWQLGAAQGLTFLFGPLLLMYLRSTRPKAKIGVLHFVPFTLYLVNYLFDGAPRLLPASFVALAQLLHLVTYSVLILHEVRKRRTADVRKAYLWKRRVAMAFLGYVLTFITYYLLVWTRLLEVEYDYMISAASSFFIYFIGYYGFNYQELWKQSDAPRYEKSGLSASASRAIAKKLTAVVSSEKLYLQNSLKLKHLADRLEIQPHYVSQVINEVQGKNFADFINEYRVENARQLLECTDMKIMNVGIASGFNNKASFNHAFKKLTGKSPSAYRQWHSEGKALVN